MLGEGSGSKGGGKRKSGGWEAGVKGEGSENWRPPVHLSKLLALSFILFNNYTIIILLALHICSLINKRR